MELSWRTHPHGVITVLLAPKVYEGGSAPLPAKAPPFPSPPRFSTKNRFLLFIFSYYYPTHFFCVKETGGPKENPACCDIVSRHAPYVVPPGLYFQIDFTIGYYTPFIEISLLSNTHKNTCSIFDILLYIINSI